MGQLHGKAAYLSAASPFLNASEKDVNKLWEAFNDVAEGFGLNVDELSEICRTMQASLEIHARAEMDQLSATLFYALDTDEVRCMFARSNESHLLTRLLAAERPRGCA